MNSAGIILFSWNFVWFDLKRACDVGAGLRLDQKNQESNEKLHEPSNEGTEFLKLFVAGYCFSEN